MEHNRNVKKETEKKQRLTNRYIQIKPFVIFLWGFVYTVCQSLVNWLLSRGQLGRMDAL